MPALLTQARSVPGRLGGVGGALVRRPVADVARDRARLAAQAGQRALERLGVPIHADDVVAVGRQPLRDCEPDPHRGARDDRARRAGHALLLPVDARSLAPPTGGHSARVRPRWRSPWPGRASSRCSSRAAATQLRSPRCCSTQPRLVERAQGALPAGRARARLRPPRGALCAAAARLVPRAEPARRRADARRRRPRDGRVERDPALPRAARGPRRPVPAEPAERAPRRRVPRPLRADAARPRSSRSSASRSASCPARASTPAPRDPEAARAKAAEIAPQVRAVRARSSPTTAPCSARSRSPTARRARALPHAQHGHGPDAVPEAPAPARDGHGPRRASRAAGPVL